MTIQQCEQWLWEQAAKAANEWCQLQCTNMHASLYLYYKQGELKVAEEKPDGFKLADGKRLGPGATIAITKARIYEIARKLPCLPEI